MSGRFTVLFPRIMSTFPLSYATMRVFSFAPIELTPVSDNLFNVLMRSILLSPVLYSNRERSVETYIELPTWQTSCADL